MNPAQVWTLVDEAKPPPGGAVVHSFTGKYLQVLPDNGDNYNEVHSYESFVWTALEFMGNTLIFVLTGIPFGHHALSRASILHRSDFGFFVPLYVMVMLTRRSAKRN